MKSISGNNLKWARQFDMLDVSWEVCPGTYAVFDRLNTEPGHGLPINFGLPEWLWEPDFRIWSTSEQQLAGPWCRPRERFMLAKIAPWNMEGAWRQFLTAAACISSSGTGGCGEGPSVLILPHGDWCGGSHTLIGLHMHKGDLNAFCAFCGRGLRSPDAGSGHPEILAQDGGFTPVIDWSVLGLPAWCECRVDEDACLTAAAGEPHMFTADGHGLCGTTVISENGGYICSESRTSKVHRVVCSHE